jgi:hypothetical protein
MYFSVEAAKVIGAYRTNPTSYKIGYQGGPNIINSGEVVHRPLSHKGASSGWVVHLVEEEWGGGRGEDFI